MAAVEALKAKFEEEINKYKQIEKDREKYISQRQRLESQLTENKLVKTELDLLDTDSKVYKLIGAVLVKQDLNEARLNVDKRLEYIEAEIKRLEETLADSAEKFKAQTQVVTELRNTLQKVLGSPQ